VSGDYCPHQVVPDLRPFGLTPYVDTSPFGRQVGFRSAQPTGETLLVLLHGVGGNASSWSPLLTELRSTGAPLPDLLIPDLPGFGESENETTELLASEVGGYLLDLANRLGWRRVHLVGHSMGGFLALDMASRGDPRIARLSTISGAYFGIIRTVNHPLVAWRTDRMAAASYASMRALARLGRLGTLAMKFAANTPLANLLLTGLIATPPELNRSVRRSVLTNLRPRSFALAAKNGIAYDATQRWARITVPTMGIFGTEDHLVPPRDAHEFADALPEATVTILPGVAHFAHLERPGEVARLLGFG
jgi:pimeloyl-ACP methyl ester carboxylesterase